MYEDDYLESASNSNSSDSTIYPNKTRNEKIVVHADIEPNYSTYAELSTINAATPSVKNQENIIVKPKDTSPGAPGITKTEKTIADASIYAIEVVNDIGDIVAAPPAPIRNTRSVKRHVVHVEDKNISNIANITHTADTTIKKSRRVPRNEEARKFEPNGTALKDYCKEIIEYGRRRQVERRTGKKRNTNEKKSVAQLYLECTRVERTLENILKEINSHNVGDN